MATLGRTKSAEPSLGVFPTRSVGNVRPPSVDRRTLTKRVLIPLTFVPATFQFTVGDERYYAAIRDKIVPPSEPLIGGSLAGNFEFYFERGRSAQTFP